MIFQRTSIDGAGIPGLLSSKAHIPSVMYTKSFLNLEESFQMFHDVSERFVKRSQHWCAFVIGGGESGKNAFFLPDFLGPFLKPNIRFCFTCFSWATHL